MIYDIIIIGGGPAGLTAAIYSYRYKMNTIVFSKNIGGLAAIAPKICNFPSYNEIKGFELMKKITEQVKSLGVQIIYEEIKEIKKTNNGFKIKTEKKEYESRKIIFASGTERQRLNVPGEGKFLGRGVSYCSTCDGPFFKNKMVSIIGGNDSALSSALLLSEFASKVFIIYRGNSFRAEPTWVELVKKNKKIQIMFNEEVEEIAGKGKVEEIKLKSGKSIKVDGVFIEIGSIPNTDLVKSLNVHLDGKGFIITDKEQRTNLNGFYAAGDVTNNNLKQIITSAAEGAVAAFNCYKEIIEESSK